MVNHFKYRDRVCIVESLLAVRLRSQEVGKPYLLWRKKWPDLQQYSSTLFNQSSAVCSLSQQKVFSWQKYEKKAQFLAHSQIYETPLLASSCLSVSLSVRPSACSSAWKKLGSHWTDFYEIWHLCIFRNSVVKIQDSLNSDKNKSYVTWRPTYFYDISRWIFLRMGNVSYKICRENQSIYFMFSKLIFFKYLAFF